MPLVRIVCKIIDFRYTVFGAWEKCILGLLFLFIVSMIVWVLFSGFIFDYFRLLEALLC